MRSTYKFVPEVCFVTAFRVNSITNSCNCKKESVFHYYCCVSNALRLWCEYLAMTRFLTSSLVCQLHKNYAIFLWKVVHRLGIEDLLKIWVRSPVKQNFYPATSHDFTCVKFPPFSGLRHYIHDVVGWKQIFRRFAGEIIIPFRVFWIFRFNHGLDETLIEFYRSFPCLTWHS